jgi:hypothetical protein
MSEFLETAILIAVLNEDEEEAERLASEMLPGELFHLSWNLTRMKGIIDRHFLEKKPAAAPSAAPGVEEG